MLARTVPISPAWVAVFLGVPPLDFWGPGLPCRPTKAVPGTPAKLRVLAERYRRRQELFHPADATDLEVCQRQVRRVAMALACRPVFAHPDRPPRKVARAQCACCHRRVWLGKLCKRCHRLQSQPPAA